MGDLLTKAKGRVEDFDSQPNSSQAWFLYSEYKSATFSDYAWDEEDISFADDIFEDLGDIASFQTTTLNAMITPIKIAAHLFADFDAAGGMIDYFAKDNPSTDSKVVSAFVKYSGAYIQITQKLGGKFIDANFSDYVYDGADQEKIRKIIQKTFYYYENQGAIFTQFDNTLFGYNFVDFKRELSTKINEWLETDPTIVDLYQVNEAVMSDGYGGEDILGYFFGLTSESVTARAPTIKLPGELADNKLFQLTPEQYKQLNNVGFVQPTARYINYTDAAVQIENVSPVNEVRANENLEVVQSSTFETSRWFSFGDDEVFQNFIRQAYWSIAKELLRTHAIVLLDSDAGGLNKIAIETLFRDQVTKWVNKENKDYGIVESSIDKGQVGYRFAQYVLNNIRANALVKILERFKSTGEVLTPEGLNDSFASAEELVKNNEEISGNDEDSSALSEEDIEAKQKFLKQCLLMSRLGYLAELNTLQIQGKTNPIHSKKPYKGRLYLVDELDANKDKSSIINKLLIPNKAAIGSFLDIKPSDHANLVPKIRLVKVYSSGSTLMEHEFKFPKHSNSGRVNSLSSVGFDRGADFGVKEFSFSFDGTTPATAKNDITANLKLYFQSFQDFVEKKAANGGHRYVDLLILPGGDKGTKKGSGAASPLQYDPSYYRIRADVGWEAESAPNAAIKKAIQKINKTFYLNMVDHEIDIKDDGSVEINVSYRAYVETALKGTTLDALASREAREALVKLREDYNKVLNKKACNLKELTSIRGQFLQIEENLRKNSFQSIIKRLIENNLMNYVQVAGASAVSFERTGYIVSPAIFVGDEPTADGETIAKKSNPRDFSLKRNVFKDIKLSNRDDNRFINYFYLADLLYVILDCLYEPDTGNINESYVAGTENFKFLLSSFQYTSAFDQSQIESVNLGNIPISVELFNEWFTENVIKPERASYPVMYFIRDLTKFLITEILLESCFKNDLDKRLQFKTTSFLGKKTGGECPISSILGSDVILDVGPAYDRGDLPLSADIEGTMTPVKDLFNYITIFAETTRGKTDKRGKKDQDEKNGIIHYQIGRDRGILKKIKFSKSDMKYIREARFFRHGADGLMQMSAVYKVSMDMVGNTLYYPGMEVFIDPRGLLGGGREFDPTIGGENPSIANKLGFGGYHLVTSVKSSIGPGKFTTSVEALFSYNGDGNPKSTLIGSGEEVTVASIDKNFINESPKTTAQKTYCDAIKNNLYKQVAATGYGFQSAYDSIDERAAREEAEKTRKAEEAAIDDVFAGFGPTMFNPNTGIYTEVDTNIKFKVVGGDIEYVGDE